MPKMKIGYLWLVLIFAVATIPLAGCGARQGAAASERTALVQRGNLTIDITGAGNLALSKTEDLAFELAGYVQEVMVKEGESVTEGQVLAQLDTSEWEKQLKTLQKALDSAQRSLTSVQSNVIKAQRNVTNAEAGVTKAQRNFTAVESGVTKAQGQVATREFSLRQTQLDIETAKYNLAQISEVKSAQVVVDGAESALEMAQANFKIARLQGAAIEDMPREIQQLTDSLEKAQDKLQDILRGKNLSLTSTVTIQIAQAQLKVEQNQKALADAQTAIEDAKTAVLEAQYDVEDAKTAVKNAQSDVEDAKTAVSNVLLDQKNSEQNVIDAQTELDEAKNLSPLVKAPFAGFITKVNVSGGDEVQKGSIAMQLADPAKFTADIVVGESDIIKVKEGGTASIQVDPVPGLNLRATVTHISPTATVQSGVVSYKVTVELENLPAGGTSGQPAPAVTPVPPRATPSPVPDGTPSQIPGRRSNPFSGSQFPGFQSRASAGAMAGALTPTSQIKVGMSVTVSIAVAESRNVLLVPNQAITYSGRDSQVKVMKAGKAEVRVIKTGINNWQFTEVTEGLSEGEEVVIPVNLSGTGSSTGPVPTSRQQAPFNLPGGGGVRIR